MYRIAIRFFLAVSLVMFCLTSCNLSGSNRLPKSTGQPYEVVLEGDTDSIVTKILTEDVPYLPQAEPLCRLIQVRRGKCKGSYLMVRNRVVVDLDSRNKNFAVKVSRDVNASPQIVVRIKAQDAKQLREKLGSEKQPNKLWDEKLRQLIDDSEIQHLASRIKPNKQKQQLAEKMFGLKMKIPAEMDASKQAKDFLWISNNTSSGMKSIIFLRVKSEERRENTPTWVPGGKVKSIADLLRKNMVGETDSMFMVLGNLEEASIHEASVHLSRGLWEMEGDAMGGPYVMKIIQPKGKNTLQKSMKLKPESSDCIVVIGFVYAPETKKKILIKQLEAAISTIQ